MHEINFWLGMEQALNGIKLKLEAPEIQWTLEILKQAKRYMVTLSFENDTGMKDVVSMVDSVLQLFREFPIEDLLAATNVDQLTTAVRAVFNHMKRIRNGLSSACAGKPSRLIGKTGKLPCR